MRYRVKFAKTGSLKFIGHLDLMRLLQKSIKRAKIPVAYSQGFNPHQLLSIALPLSLGMEGFGEYFEIELEAETDDCKMKLELNKALPFGLEILQVLQITNGEKNAASITRAALYEAVVETDLEEIDKMMSCEEILVMKKTKSGVKEANIREDIIQMEYRDGKVSMLLSAGSERNLKPEYVLGVFARSEGAKVRRLELFKKSERGYEPLISGDVE